MQTDMHFYSIYDFARTIGFYPWAARLIAYSSQHTDYAGCNGLLCAGDNLVEKIMTSHQPLDAKLKETQNATTPWLVFHFWPGGENATNPYDRMRCQKNGILIQPMMDNVIRHKDENFFLHAAGIALHGMYDCFSHDGFIGLNHQSNRIRNGSLQVNFGHQLETTGNHILDALRTFREKIQGTVAETFPVGHSAIGTLADQPFLRISYETEDGRQITRDNPTNFLAAAEMAFQFLTRILSENAKYGKATGKNWSDLEGEVTKLISQEGSLAERIKNWRKLIKSGLHFPIKAGDGRIWYAPEAWSYNQLRKQLEAGRDKDFCNPLLFTIAARILRDFILGEMRKAGFILG
ncbi:MAG: DUF6765 family protein [Patescibacteria group bacterium]